MTALGRGEGGGGEGEGSGGVGVGSGQSAELLSNWNCPHYLSQRPMLSPLLLSITVKKKTLIWEISLNIVMGNKNKTDQPTFPTGSVF